MYDGAVKIDTSLDHEGLKKSMEKFKQAVEDGAKSAQKEFSKVDDAVSQTARNAEKLDSSFKVDDESQREMVKTLDNLNAKIYVQQQQLSKLQAEYTRVVSRQGENSDAALKLQKQILNTEGSIDSLIKKSDKMVSSMSGGAQEVSSDIKSTGSLLTSIFDAAGLHVGDSINGILEAFEGMKRSAGTSSASASDALGGVSIAGAAIGGAVIGGIGVASGALLDLQKRARELASEIEFSANRIKVALGLTDEEAKTAEKSITNIYRAGLVDSRGEAEESLTAVMRLMGAQGKEAESLANKVVGIKVAFGEDFATTARTASTMMQTFGIDGSTALDIIAAGLQTSANKNGDLLDVLNEYSPAFKRMGFDGEEMLGKIVSATDAGAFSADKAADAFKEFYNRAAGGDASFVEALNDLGISGEDAMKKITSGGEIAKSEFELVATKLSSVTSESKQARIASLLFGSQWEDVGTTAVLALADVDNSIDSTKGKAETAYKELSENTQTNAKKFERTWGESFTKVGAQISGSLLGPLGTLFNLIDELKGGLQGNGNGAISQLINLLNGKSYAEEMKKANGGYATGTASASPGWHWVGEGGPELKYFHGGEVVKTAAQSMAMANSAMAGSAAFPMTSITNYNIKVDDLDTFNAIVNRVKYEQQYERMGYSGR